MGDVRSSVLAVLTRHLSAVNARSVLARSAHACRLSQEITAADLPRLILQLRQSSSLFLSPSRHRDLVSDLEALLRPAEVGPETIAIEREQDIVDARTSARQICLDLGAKTAVAQKVATIVSELARNIVLYTPGGQVELIPKRPPPAILVRAIDRGAGISGLDAILSGNYRSKTGLGRGLFGTRQVADSFRIETGPTGTRIEAEVRLS